MKTLTEDAPPPADLRLAWMCERWQSMPETGGVMDQDFQTVHRMGSLSGVYNTVTKWRNYTGEKIHLLTDHDRKILRWLLDNKINFNA